MQIKTLNTKGKRPPLRLAYIIFLLLHYIIMSLQRNGRLEEDGHGIPVVLQSDSDATVSLSFTLSDAWIQINRFIIVKMS